VLKAAPASGFVKTNSGVGSFISLQITDGITFHTNITGAAGSTISRSAGEVMRITHAWNVWIGWTPSGIFQVNKDASYATDSTAALRLANATTPAKMIAAWYDAGIDSGYIQSLQSWVWYKSLFLNPNAWSVGIWNVAISASLKLDVEWPVGATQYCDNNGLNCFTAAANTLSGAGTAGYLAKYTSSTAMSASQIQDNGTGVGIGKAAAWAFKLDVWWKLAAWNYSQSAGSVNTNSLEIWWTAPNSTNGDGTIFFHDHGDIAHQLRYTIGTLFLEAAGNGYGTSTTPNLQVGWSVYAGINGGWIGIGTNLLTAWMKLDVLWDVKIRGTQINTDAIEVSTYNSGNRYAYIDLHGDDTYTDYSLRLLRDNTGLNGNSWLIHRGTGNFYISANEAAPIRMLTSGAERLTILPSGYVGIWNATPNARFTIWNNVATGPMDNYSEYQVLLYDGWTAINAYGIWVRSNTLLFNTNSLADFDVNGVNALSLSSASLDIKQWSIFRLFDADSSNFVGIKSPSVVTTNVSWTLPSTDGGSNSVLSTDGAGNLSWASLGWGGSAKSVKKFPENRFGTVWYYNCVIMWDDSVKCWGQDNVGQVWDWQPAVNKAFPQTVPLPWPVDKLYTNTAQVFALLKNGTVYGWWGNWNWDVGDGTSWTHRYYPVQLPWLSSVVKIAISQDLAEGSGGSACALTSGWALFCWWYGAQGQVWNNLAAATNATPVQIFSSGIADVYDGMWYFGGFCVKKTDASTWCWWYNGYGNVGDNTTTQRNAPVNISFSTVSKMSSAGSYWSAYWHRCAVKTDGTVWCWGNNSNGQLGLWDTTQRNLPVQVSWITTAVDVVCSLLNTYVLLSDGTIRVWWYNGSWQLGNGNVTQYNSPTTAVWLSWVTKIVHGGDVYGGWYNSVCFLINNGTIKCTWYNGYGQVGNDTATSISTPAQVIWITNAVDVMQRNYSSGWEVCALLSTWVMKCWWYNAQGQLGNGTTSTMYIPQDVLF
jgi:alpha-tubulin suppressor-like RCC1 family protein